MVCSGNDMKTTDPDDIILLGLKGHVTALHRNSGKKLWSTALPRGFFADDFVSLVSDSTRVYAYGWGKLFCLELSSGKILWTNDLPGLGSGLGMLCVPNGESSPDIATMKAKLDAESSFQYSPGPHAGQI